MPNKDKNYFIWKDPKGNFSGQAVERKYDLSDPDIEGWFDDYSAFKREVKKLGWKIVKVQLREIK